MPDLTNPVPLRLEEAGSLPAVAPLGGESIPNDLMNYVTQPSKKIIVVN